MLRSRSGYTSRRDSVGGHLDSDLLEQTQNRSGLDRARGVVVSGDQNYRGFRECVPQTLKLPEREDDRGIGRSNRMKEIPRDHHDVRHRPDDAVNRGAKGLRHVGFSLIDAARSLPVVLPDTEVRIGDVCEFHGWRMKSAAGKGKNSGVTHRAHRRASVRVFRGVASLPRRHPPAQARGKERGHIQSGVRCG